MYAPENPEWAWSQAPLQPGPLAFAPYPGQAARSGAPWSAPQQRPAAGFAPSSGDPQFSASWGEWDDPDGRRRRFRRSPFDKFRKRPFDKFGKFDKFEKMPFDKFGKRRKY